MLKMSQNAGERLTELLQDSGPGCAVRIDTRDRRLTVCRDRKRSGDLTFAHQGKVVLVVDERISRVLTGHMLDTRATETGTRLRLKPQ